MQGDRACLSTLAIDGDLARDITFLDIAPLEVADFFTAAPRTVEQQEQHVIALAAGLFGLVEHALDLRGGEDVLGQGILDRRERLCRGDIEGERACSEEVGKEAFDGGDFAHLGGVGPPFLLQLEGIILDIATSLSRVTCEKLRDLDPE